MDEAEKNQHIKVDSTDRILAPQREYGCVVLMLKINWHVNQLRQLILTHTMEGVEAIASTERAGGWGGGGSQSILVCLVCHFLQHGPSKAADHPSCMSSAVERNIWVVHATFE